MPESQYLQHRRELKLGIKKPDVKVRKPLAKVSANRKVINNELAKVVKEFLARPENKYCHIKMKGCTGEAVTVHHAAGRLGSKLFDQRDWVPSCAMCNLTVEISDLEARSKGFKKSKFKA